MISKNGNILICFSLHIVGEKPYICQICNQGFRTSTDMKKHCGNAHFKGKPLPPHLVFKKRPTQKGAGAPVAVVAETAQPVPDPQQVVATKTIVVSQPMEINAQPAQIIQVLSRPC